MAEERKQRVRVGTDVVINGTVKAEGLDLSEDGMYIYTRNPFLDGSTIGVSFRLDGERIEVTAEVVHSQEGVGVGVRFVDLPVNTADKIKRFISEKC